MADLNQHQGGSGAQAEPVVRARWMPKPEQVLILESIFNSGMVNPPKDETVRIRKLLQKFGSVGDANVFYWFQNRRSRSRRRQRQLQASLMQHPAAATGGGGVPYEPTSSSYSNSSYSAGRGFFTFSPSSSSSDDLFAISRQMGFMEIAQSAPPFACSSDVSHQLHCQPGTIAVFIDGVASEVPRGPVDLRAMFGQNVMMLVHSTGEFLPVNEHGILMHSLQMGESYFLRCMPNLESIRSGF